MNAMTKGATEEQAAAQAFGDLKQLQAALFAYIGNSAFYYIKGAAAFGDTPPAICRFMNFPRRRWTRIAAGSWQCADERRRLYRFWNRP